jgi:hypothetical protein
LFRLEQKSVPHFSSQRLQDPHLLAIGITPPGRLSVMYPMIRNFRGGVPTNQMSIPLIYRSSAFGLLFLPNLQVS